VDIGRLIKGLPSEVETALFRIVQERLTNVRRHSGSDTANIRLEKESNQVKLQVSDRDRGIPAGLGNEIGWG
jgi:signal transduction histidine kinase